MRIYDPQSHTVPEKRIERIHVSHFFTQQTNKQTNKPSQAKPNKPNKTHQNQTKQTKQTKQSKTNKTKQTKLNKTNKAKQNKQNKTKQTDKTSQTKQTTSTIFVLTNIPPPQLTVTHSKNGLSELQRCLVENQHLLILYRVLWILVSSFEHDLQGE